MRIEPHLPLDVAALMACSVPTGWGSAVNAGPVRQGDVVVVVGTGGVGCNAVQGAAMAGAGHVIAVDPVEFRREFARMLGATHAVAGTGEAAALARELSRGTGADVVVLATGTTDPETTGGAYRCLGKGGTLVLTGLADHTRDTRRYALDEVNQGYQDQRDGTIIRGMLQHQH